MECTGKDRSTTSVVTDKVIRPPTREPYRGEGDESLRPEESVETRRNQEFVPLRLEGRANKRLRSSLTPRISPVMPSDPFAREEPPLLSRRCSRIEKEAEFIDTSDLFLHMDQLGVPDELDDNLQDGDIVKPKISFRPTSSVTMKHLFPQIE
mmetsp:Transcript_11209/g.22932  ORF Transcript_11209/g.22932 Transcript_11209/m.22932 type:complete len:152 (-) Transcript_11209:322-777(-)